MPNVRTGARIARRVVQKFLQGVGATRWRLAYGHFNSAGRLSRADGKRYQDMTADQVIELLPFLRAKNAEGMSIYVGPMSHEVAYLDDVDSAGLDRLDSMGLPILAVVETSPGSLQVWFPVPDGVTAWSLSATLCQLAGGDEKAHESGSGLQPRIGRLPGMTNSKPSRRMVSGLFPYVRLLRVTDGPLIREQVAFLAKLTVGAAGLDLSSAPAAISDAADPHAAGRAGAAARGKSDLRSDEQRRQVDGAIDRSAADWRDIRRELRGGATFQQCAALLSARRPDKSADYVRRTVARAAASVGLRDLVPDEPDLQRFCEMYLRDRRRS